MSVVIVGGNERMAGQYEDICRQHGCKAKVFTKESGSLKRKLGSPDLLILFISTVSHKWSSVSPKRPAGTRSLWPGCTPAAPQPCGRP